MRQKCVYYKTCGNVENCSRCVIQERILNKEIEQIREKIKHIRRERK